MDVSVWSAGCLSDDADADADEDCNGGCDNGASDGERTDGERCDWSPAWPFGNRIAPFITSVISASEYSKSQVILF